ncbi:MAG: tetratricopeptide repeat protein [Thomasclavelia sp.]
MRCKKCKTKNKAKAVYCSNCGEPLEKHDKKKTIMIVSIIIAILIAVIGGIFLAKTKIKEKEYQNKITTAQRYVEEKEYEKAEEIYLEAIDIEPKKPQAYIELADVYAEQGEYNQANNILDTALKNLDKHNQDVITEKKEEIEKVINNNSKKIYANILDSLYNYIKSGWEKYYDEIDLYDYEFCYLFPMYYSSPSYIDKIGYTFIDLNSDGIEELLIGMRSDGTDNSQSIIYELYTYVDGKVIQLATSGERYSWQLCKDYTLYFEGSGGAYSHSYDHCKLSSDARNFTIIESIKSEPDENWENVYWYYTTSGLYDPVTYNTKNTEYSLISEEEGNIIRKSWPQRVEYALTYFNEYTPQNN